MVAISHDNKLFNLINDLYDLITISPKIEVRLRENSKLLVKITKDALEELITE